MATLNLGSHLSICLWTQGNQENPVSRWPVAGTSVAVRKQKEEFLYSYIQFFFLNRRPCVTYTFCGSNPRRNVIETYVLGLCFSGKTTLNIVQREGQNNV